MVADVLRSALDHAPKTGDRGNDSSADRIVQVHAMQVLGAQAHMDCSHTQLLVQAVQQIVGAWNKQKRRSSDAGVDNNDKDGSTTNAKLAPNRRM